MKGSPRHTCTTLTRGECFPGNKVVISVNSSYPYSWDTLSQGVIVAQRAFMYYARIPKWSTGATISINGSDPTPCTPVHGLHAIRVEPGTTNFTLNLPLDIVAGSSQCLRSYVL